jgi:hypothetical protein
VPLPAHLARYSSLLDHLVEELVREAMEGTSPENLPEQSGKRPVCEVLPAQKSQPP